MPDVRVPDVRVPDVSVIVPVYNTMPYLTACLDSLVAQSIGRDRLQIVAVDDGSTDGSGDELDRFARAYPDVFTVIHQPNSGGPAQPCNRGLDVASGRFLFFIGADDYLGPEALERLVARADEWDSDVVIGRMEGVGGRVVDQKLFTANAPDINFLDHPLANSLSNTKLFRSSLIRQHRIRYALDLKVGSDQPFVVEAMTRARRVSVLADYTCYYAVRRGDSTNITYSSSWQSRLHDLGAVVNHIASVVEPGPVRDAILKRHFLLDLGKLIRVDLPTLPPEDQRALAAGFAKLADSYLTDGISRALWASARLRLRLAQAGELESLHRVLRFQAEAARPPMVLDGDRVYSWFPGFRDPRTSYPDEWYEMTAEGTWDRLVRGVVISDVRLGRAHLEVSGQVGVSPDSAKNVRLALLRLGPEEVPPPNRRLISTDVPAATESAVELIPLDYGGPSGLIAAVPFRQLLPRDTDGKGAHPTDPARWSLRLRVDVGRWTYDLPLQLSRVMQTVTWRQGLQRHRITLWSSDRDGVVTAVERLHARSSARAR
ncbi:hypothetical protein GCM10009841_23050 [Microlunatus panaciterrae]